MPQYNLGYQIAPAKNAWLISLTKINDDGSARVLHYVENNQHRPIKKQLTFGTYAPSFAVRKLEYAPGDPVGFEGEAIEDEEFYRHLLGEDILTRILEDHNFLARIERACVKGNHSHLIEAAQKLKYGLCQEWAQGVGSQIAPCPFRKEVVKDYWNYLLGCDGIRVIAHPEGLYTNIQMNEQLHHDAGFNVLHITQEAARTIRKGVKNLLEKSEYYLLEPDFFVGKIVESALSPNCHITEPMASQQKLVDDLFELAERHHFFPTHPKDMIRSAWRANTERLAHIGRMRLEPRSNASVLFAPPMPGQLLRAPVERCAHPSFRNWG